MIESILLAFSCGLLDRLRGDTLDVPYSKTAEAIIYGAMVAVLLGLHSWPILLFALLWALGASFGWGSVIGPALTGKPLPDKEWWQVGFLKRNRMAALIVRGLLWGVCIMPMAYFDPEATLLGFAMGGIFPAAIYLAKAVNVINTSDIWAVQEFYRGWLVGLVALILGMI